MAIVVRQLRESDDRGAFRSGHADLDRFFHSYAGQNQFKLHIGTTYVAVDERDLIVGFATVASCSIEAKDLPRKLVKKLPRYPIPALRLARMAVAADLRGQGIGSHLMRAVFLLARDQERRTGCAFVVVDAKADSVSYYEQFGFETLPVLAGELEARPVPRTNFLEIDAIPDVQDQPPDA